MRKEYEKAGLPDYENPDINAEKAKEKEFIEKIEEREKATGRKLDIGVKSRKGNKEKAVSRTINGVKNQRFENMPLRIAYQKDKVDMGKLPIWYLQAIGSMTVEEKRAFEEQNKKDLTINEIIAGQLLDGVLEKDADATKLFWDLQKTLMGKKTVINEIHQTIKRPDSIMSDILADIETNAMEAEKVPRAEVKSKPKITEAEVIDGAVQE
jgi:hypothetical protein